MDQIDKLLNRGVANILPSKTELKKKLESKAKLNIYLGIDPTSTHIHLGHAVVLRKLNQFASLGHNVTFLIGDFTALIGDTSDKEAERVALTTSQIEDNFQTYKKQAEKILDFSKINIAYNSKWLSKLNFEDIVKLTSHFNVGDFVGRELIRKRLNENKRVGLHEALYPVMQGYDSYHLNTDVQLGGKDQIFNMQAGRTLIKDLRKKESFVLTTEYLIGTDGRKMSKSWGNAIWLDDKPYDMYAKIMAIKDELLREYFILATNLSEQIINSYFVKLKKGEESPLNIKKILAYEIVSSLYGQEQSKKAAREFLQRVQKKEIVNDIQIIKIKATNTLLDLLLFSKTTSSKSDAKRLLKQKGVRINAKTASDLELNLENNDLIEIGKRKVFRVSID